MKNLILGCFASVALFGCSPSAEAEVETEIADTTAATIETTHDEGGDALAFNGVTKGAFMLYGHEEIDSENAVSQEEMFNTFKETGSFEGKVMVSINEVCQKAGCWINFKKSDDKNVMVFFRDHFNIPIDESAGKAAILYGQLETDTLSVDFQKHLLDDAAEAGEEVSQADYDKITEEKVDISFDCASILVKS